MVTLDVKPVSLPVPKSDSDRVPVESAVDELGEYQLIDRSDLQEKTELPPHELQHQHDQLQISRLTYLSMMYGQRQRGVIDRNMYDIVARNRGYGLPLIALGQASGTLVGSTPLNSRPGIPFPRPSTVLDESEVTPDLPSGESLSRHIGETETVEPFDTEEEFPTGRSTTLELESEQPAALSPETRESVAKARVKGYFSPRFPRVRQIELSDRSVERTYSRPGQSCHSHRYLLIDLLHNGWHLPEFALFFNFYADHPVTICETELNGRLRYQKAYPQDFGHLMRADKTPQFLNPVPMPLFDRHVRFATRFGHFLASESLSPNYVIRLGFSPTVSRRCAETDELRGRLLAGVTSSLFVDYLATYLQSLARSMYLFARAGHLHRDPALVCGISALDRTLDDLVSGLATQYPEVMKLGGLVLT
ncbi:unnamed protein product [Oikopleura dioica]|uniref:Uncharacterized protein n=1 Tax=Oikopleura dioica TaxID=34765 RepID=E4WR40_OIKDI|nr:unnamed protein product [Oikopleura dioica]